MSNHQRVLICRIEQELVMTSKVLIMGIKFTFYTIVLANPDTYAFVTVDESGSSTNFIWLDFDWYTTERHKA